ncbi:DUF3892 domain-containing protein [Pseudomonas sp. Irchel 3H9]|uniref:DUF3892 domain-containing protein n=1 Tax=Pseudomonas sp. Irchel 3H9 TaxID=2009043 RepID=UPI000BA353F6|nr:DUF3892 domain-containing protein [Pseudomonas sp. Irchel 3H9]
MAEYFILGVSYSEDGAHIDWVQIGRLEEPEPKQKRVKFIGPVSRQFVVDLIESESATFKTLPLIEKTGKLRPGANVRIYENDFITTEPDHKEENNLENLPRFSMPDAEIEAATERFVSIF